MQTAQEHREKAAQAEKAAQESWERSDTDGFLSQWASGLTARLHYRQAEILENGGTSEFPGLFNEAGERVKAKLLKLEDRFKGFGYKWVWLVLDEDNQALAWVNDVDQPPNPRSKMAQMGLHVEDETAPAVAFMDGRGRGLGGQAWVAVKRTDGGYPEGAVVYGKERV